MSFPVVTDVLPGKIRLSTVLKKLGFSQGVSREVALERVNQCIVYARKIENEDDAKYWSQVKEILKVWKDRPDAKRCDAPGCNSVIKKTSKKCHLHANKGPKHVRPVLCLTTGETFPSLISASRSIGRSVNALSAALRWGWKCGEKEWAYESPKEEII